MSFLSHIPRCFFFLTFVCGLRVFAPQMCTKQRMSSGMYPSAPFINQYDTAEDIKRRQHRIKLKVKGELRSGINTRMSDICLASC